MGCARASSAAPRFTYAHPSPADHTFPPFPRALHKQRASQPSHSVFSVWQNRMQANGSSCHHARVAAWASLAVAAAAGGVVAWTARAWLKRRGKQSGCGCSIAKGSCLYVPPHFSSADDKLADSIMRSHPFVTLISPSGDDCPFVSHIPMHLHSDCGSASARLRTLVGHVAAASPHAKHLLACTNVSTAIFHGPHAYMSPSV